MSPAMLESAWAALVSLILTGLAVRLYNLACRLSETRARLAETRLMLFSLVELAERELTRDPRGVPHLGAVIELRRLFPEAFEPGSDYDDAGDVA